MRDMDRGFAATRAIHLATVGLALSIAFALGVASCQEPRNTEEPENPPPPMTAVDTLVTLPGGVPMEMVWIPPGTFTMGTTAEQAARWKGLRTEWRLFLLYKVRFSWEFARNESLAKGWRVLSGKDLWEIWTEMEQPAHEVEISQGFFMGRYELTQAQWAAVMDTISWLDDPGM